MSNQAKLALVTGATDGLGHGVAHALSRAGYAVLVHGRDRVRGEAVAVSIRDGGGEARFYRADFAALSEVRTMAEQILSAETRLDVLINNAGLGVEDHRRVSHDGHEMTFQVDYLAPYLLTQLLRPLVERSTPSRIVNVASAGQAAIDFDDVMLTRDWNGVQAYCQAKLAQIMMTFDLADELSVHGVAINALHPASMMPTKIVVGRFGVQSTLEDGVRNVARLAIDPALQGVTGRYFNRDREDRADRQAYDVAARARLRTLSDQLCKQDA